jgi:hypothetical protein
MNGQATHLAGVTDNDSYTGCNYTSLLISVSQKSTMPRPRTDPPTTDFTQKIEVADLRPLGYFAAGPLSFTLTLPNPYTGEPNRQIACELTMSEVGGWLRLRYSVKEIPYDYMIQLEAVASNLGRGVYYLFICPLSGQRAKKLYSCWGSPYFAHRAALGVRYETQYVAGLFGKVVPYFKNHKRVAKDLDESQRKRIYAGKYTRWYRRALKSICENQKLGSLILDNIRSNR